MFTPFSRRPRPSHKAEVAQVRFGVTPVVPPSSASRSTSTPKSSSRTSSTTAFPYKQPSVRSGFDQTYRSQTPSVRSQRTVGLSSSSSTTLTSETSKPPSAARRVRTTVSDTQTTNSPNDDRSQPSRGKSSGGWPENWVGSRESEFQV